MIPNVHATYMCTTIYKWSRKIKAQFTYVQERYLSHFYA